MKKIKEKYIDILLNSIPFKGFSIDQLDDALISMNSKIIKYSPKEYILNAGETITSFGIVLMGNVLIEKTDYFGNVLILGENQVGDFFGETYAQIEDFPLMVDVRSASESEIIFLDLSYLKTKFCENKDWYLLFLRNLLISSQFKNIALSQRNFHTAPKNARMRIASYLSYRRIIERKDAFHIPFDRQELANYLNLDRSALSRELSKMKADGLIDYKKNYFKLKHIDTNSCDVLDFNI